jgi:hypothetical protein
MLQGALRILTGNRLLVAVLIFVRPAMKSDVP